MDNMSRVSCLKITQDVWKQVNFVKLINKNSMYNWYKKNKGVELFLL